MAIRYRSFYRQRGVSGLAAKIMMARISRKLQLDENQAERFEAVQTTLGNLRAEFGRARRRNFATVTDLLAQNGFKRDKIRELIMQQHADFDKHADTLLDAVGEFYDSLDNQQRDKLGMFWQRMHSHRHACRC